MPVRPIIRFPDPRLRAAAEPVRAFDDRLRSLATDLFDTIRAVAGLGIAGPHIGVLKRIVALDIPDVEHARIYINPRIIRASGERVRGQEGSVSMPGMTEEIERHAQVHVSYQDLDGVERVEHAEGLLAICHQHEIDQLDGVFWIQKLSRLKRDRLIKRYEKTTRA